MMIEASRETLITSLVYRGTVMNSSLLFSIARKARGVLGMALTWGLAWVPVSVALLPVYLRTRIIESIDARYDVSPMCGA